MTTFPMDLTDALLLKDDVEASLKAYTPSQDERIALEIDDEVAEWLCVALFAAVTEDTQCVVLTQLPEERSKTILAALARQYGYGLIRPASSANLPALAEMPNGTNGTAPMPPAALFFPCLTPVGPSKCLHPGSHHAAHGGRCTHPGCDCAAFSPGIEGQKASVSAETVMDYLRRVTLLKAIIWDGDDTFAALHRAWIPGAAPASDWRPMLGRVFPTLAETFSEVAPI